MMRPGTGDAQRLPGGDATGNDAEQGMRLGGSEPAPSDLQAGAARAELAPEVPPLIGQLPPRHSEEHPSAPGPDAAPPECVATGLRLAEDGSEIRVERGT